jgi:hypothetical protein
LIGLVFLKFAIEIFAGGATYGNGAAFAEPADFDALRLLTELPVPLALVLAALEAFSVRFSLAVVSPPLSRPDFLTNSLSVVVISDEIIEGTSGAALPRFDLGGFCLPGTRFAFRPGTLTVDLFFVVLAVLAETSGITTAWVEAFTCGDSDAKLAFSASIDSMSNKSFLSAELKDLYSKFQQLGLVL